MSKPSMHMIFTTSISTPLYTSQWTPTTAEGYAGTCVFLITLAVISRALSVWRHFLEIRWHDKAIERRYVTISDETIAVRERLCGFAADKHTEAILTSAERDVLSRSSGIARKTFRTALLNISTNFPRACIFVLQAGVGYLLMLAAMTLNVGYFLSVLGGLFLGELVLGGNTPSDEEHH